LIFAPLGIAQTSLALRSLIAKIQNSKFQISNSTIRNIET